MLGAIRNPPWEPREDEGTRPATRPHSGCSGGRGGHPGDHAGVPADVLEPLSGTALGGWSVFRGHLISGWRGSLPRFLQPRTAALPAALRRAAGGVWQNDDGSSGGGHCGASAAGGVALRLARSLFQGRRRGAGGHGHHGGFHPGHLRPAEFLQSFFHANGGRRGLCLQLCPG